MWKRLKQELELQYQRYSSTKYGKLAAVVIYFLIFLTSQNATNALTTSLRPKLSAQNIYVIAVSLGILITEVLWCLGMLVVYTQKWSFFQQYRVAPEKLWPWESDRKAWDKLLLRSGSITAFYVLIFIPLNLWIDSQVSFNIVISPQQAPSLSTVIPQIILMMFLEDIFFFTFHWLLHQPQLYKYHKIHHEFSTTVSIAGLHFHPLEFFLIQSLSSLMNMRIVMMTGPLHLSTLVSWFILRIWDANNAHSGYNFSWAPIQLLPFCTNDQFHDYHHSHNQGNYSSHFRLWDTIFSTNIPFTDKKLAQLQQTAPKNGKSC